MTSFKLLFRVQGFTVVVVGFRVQGLSGLRAFWVFRV